MSDIRIDKWLWAARFYKTRNLAKTAIESGQVLYQKQRCKASRMVEVGTELRIRKGEQEFIIEVLALSDQRGPAAVAQTLYQETAAGLEQRLRAAEDSKLARRSFQAPEHKPNKQQRRRLTAFKHEQPE